MSIPRLSPTDSQVNLSNSILHYFDLPTFHDTFKPLDELLEKNPDRRICLFLFDGFGKYIQKKLKNFCPFMIDHQRFDMEAVYPPTTVAATTALLSGKYPIETGWLGWTQYFRKSNLYVEMFSGRLEGTEDRFVSGPKPADILTYRSIVDMINDRLGNGSATSIMGFKCLDESRKASAGVFFEEVEKAIRDSNRNRFTYAYWTEPDHSLHDYGVNSEQVRKVTSVIDQCVAEICRRNPEVLFLFIADHGHVAQNYIDIRKYPNFCDTLEDSKEPRFSIEARFATFFVKPDKHEEFKVEYRRHFASDFELYDRAQIYDEHVFGWGTPHPDIEDFIGDYTLISISNKSLWDGFNFKLNWGHAGATKEERILSLGVANA